MLAAALAGCGTGQGDGSSGLAQVSPTASTSLGSPLPTDTSGATSTPTSGSATSTGNGSTTATYPTTPEGYANAALAAFDSGNSTRLASLAGPGGGEFPNIGQPNKHWHYYKDVLDGVYTDSFFDNDDGDRITIAIDPTKLGKPGAVHDVSIDKTEYGSTADSMVTALMYAFSVGNKYRMTALSDSGTTIALRSNAMPASWNLHDDNSTTGHTVVTVDANNFTFKCDVTLSKLGHAHAITKAS